MTLEEKIFQVEQFYASLEIDLMEFQNESKLSCIKGCSSCCQSPEIETTILELLPLAFYLYKENKAEAFYDALLENPSPTCALYNPIGTVIQKGGCANYPYRALVCRLFGFSYTRDKIGKPKLLTCSTIKETHAEAYEKSIAHATDITTLPMASNYQSQLTAIDPNLSQQFYPINKAMIQAIEIVMTHFRYTNIIGLDDIKIS